MSPAPRALVAIAPALLVHLALAAPAHADSFESVAAGARRVAHLDDVVWALTAACDQGDDVAQRQCRQIRDARASTLVGAKVILAARRSALTLGAWSPATKSLPVALSACIDCTGVVVEGRTWHLTGKPARVEGDRVTTELLIDNARTFGTEAAAKAWLGALDAARIEMVVTIPEKRRVMVGGKDGLQLDLLAYRVIAPCTGAVVFASPPSGAVAAERAACSAAEIEPVPALTKELVREAMAPVLEATAACYAKLKVPGDARLELTIAADGSIAAYTRTGAFRDSPTGACIDAAVKLAVFPRSKRPTTTIGYPLSLP